MELSRITMRDANGKPEFEFLGTPGFQGWEELADVAIQHHYRESVDFRMKEPLLKASEIRSLCALAFHSSLGEEEGRTPRFKITLGESKQCANVLRFRNSIRLSTPETLRKLWPAVSWPDCSLLVRSDQGFTLTAIGICAAGYDVMEILLRELWTNPRLAPAVGTIMLSVEGAGNISLITSRSAKICLRAGILRALEPWWIAFGELGLFSYVEQQVLEQLRSCQLPSVEEYLARTRRIPDYCQTLWSRVLAHVIERRHGGVFLVLPEVASNDTTDLLSRYSIEPRYDIDRLELSDLVVQHCKEILTARVEQNVDDFISKSQAELCVRALVLRTMQALSDLSGVDGCVVLDRLFRVVGFGCKIISDTDWGGNKPLLPFCKLGTEDQIDNDVIRSFGTRHQSAISVSRRYPNMRAFVISQDGDLRLFFSDEFHAYGVEGLWSGI